MKVLSLHQPWATLIALGVKRFETRSGPPNGDMRPEGVRAGIGGHKIDRGETIGIASTLRKPDLERVGDFDVEHAESFDDAGMVVDRYYWLASLDGQGHTLPLGELLCKVTVVDALPMLDRVVAHRGRQEFSYEGRHRIFVDLDPAGGYDPDPLWDIRLLRTNPAGGPPVSIADQIPYGDWAPGRWAIELTDVRSMPFPVSVRNLGGTHQGVWETGDHP